jgi:hypothetical protein
MELFAPGDGKTFSLREKYQLLAFRCPLKCKKMDVIVIRKIRVVE